MSLLIRIERTYEIVYLNSKDLLTLLFGSWGEYGEIGRFFIKDFSLGLIDVYPVLLFSDMGLFGVTIIFTLYYYILKSNNKDDHFTISNKRVVLTTIILTSFFGNTLITFPIFLIIPLLLSYLNRLNIDEYI
jgi:hypothetical protein